MTARDAEARDLPRDRAADDGEGRAHDHRAYRGLRDEAFDAGRARLRDAEPRNVTVKRERADLDLERDQERRHQRVGDVRRDVGHDGVETERHAQRDNQDQMQAEERRAANQQAHGDGARRAARRQLAASQSSPDVANLLVQLASRQTGRARVHDSGGGGGLLPWLAMRRYIWALLFSGSSSSTALNSSTAGAFSPAPSISTPSKTRACT